MIDKQDEVFTRVMNGVIADFTESGVSMLDEKNFASDTSVMPSVFPHVSIVQTNSVTLRSSEEDRKSTRLNSSHAT